MNETIAAIATPFGPGAIGIIRLSGDEALAIAGDALGRDWEGQEPRRVQRAQIRSLEGEVIDDVLVTIFPRPNSLSLIHI